MNFSYQFPAVKGLQAGREYYIAMVPLKFLSKTLDWIVENPIDEKNDIDIKIMIKYILLFLVFFTFIF